jgi:hypothetical protein
MTYIATIIAMGMSMICVGADGGPKVLFALGFLLFSAGLFIGHIVDDRTENRIKKLEDKIEELKK